MKVPGQTMFFGHPLRPGTAAAKALPNSQNLLGRP